MHKLILIFSVFLISTEVLAAFTKEECGSFDFSDRYPPVRDQDGHGYCWAFSGAALYEEHLCLESRKNPDLNYKCGQKLSVLDFSRCDFSLESNYGEGGQPYQGLDCILSKKADYEVLTPGGNHAIVNHVKKTHNQGVCLEEYAPYDKYRKGWGRVWGDFTGANYPAAINNRFVEYKNICAKEEDPEKLEILATQYSQILSKLLPDHEAMGVDFKDALTKKQMDEYFLRDILVTPQCEEKRIFAGPKMKSSFQLLEENRFIVTRRVNGRSVSEERVTPGKSMSERLKILKDSFKQSRSVVGSICWTKYSNDPLASKLERFFNPATGSVGSDSCGGHGVVYKGMRWNDRKNRCEISVRNSWGRGSALNGWEDAERVLKHTFAFSSLKEVK